MSTARPGRAGVTDPPASRLGVVAGRLRRAPFAAAALPLVAATLTLSVNAHAAGHRSPLPGSKPTWVASAADRGAAPTSDQIDARVYLAGRDRDALAAYALAVTDPASPSYRRFLTPGQFRSRFGPSSAQVRAVRSWLGASGLRVSGANDHYLTVHGPIAAAERAFGAQLREYAHGGAVDRAPSGDVSVPAAVAGAVLGVSGLDSSSRQVRPLDAIPPTGPAVFRAGPCSRTFGERAAEDLPRVYGRIPAWEDCGHTPAQLRKAYGVDHDAGTGAGVTIAIVDAYDGATIRADADRYAAAHGDAPFRPGQYTAYDADTWKAAGCAPQEWYGEQAMDIEAAHALAPDANIAYVGAASCNDTDLMDALNRVVDNHLADMVSDSWAETASQVDAGEVKAFEQAFQQGAVEGIGFYFSSGDCGYEDPATSCGKNDKSDRAQVNYPSSDPWVTGVGGTTLADRDGDYQHESGWGLLAVGLSDDRKSWSPAAPGAYPAQYSAGGGGGVSEVFTQPYYQRGIVPDALATHLASGATAKAPMRVVPDVAAVGDNNTGILVGQTQRLKNGKDEYLETRWGGTSLSCPVFVAIQALAQQAQHGVPIGFANPAIYARYGTAAFHDVTDHPLGQGVSFGVARDDYADRQDPTSKVLTTYQTFAHNGALQATAGYDDVTGVGTPSAGYVPSYRR